MPDSIPIIDLKAAHAELQTELEAAALEVLRSGWYILGPQVRAFEEEFAAWLGLPAGSAVGVASGTDALVLALRACDRAPGDEVIVPSHTAVATVETIRDEKLAENAAAMGERLTDGLVELQGRYPVIGDIRGYGLMVGTEFTRNGQPDKDITKAVQKACIERNLLLLTCGSYENVIRWIPPLVVNAQQIDEGLTVFEDALQAVSR